MKEYNWADGTTNSLKFHKKRDNSKAKITSTGPDVQCKYVNANLTSFK